MMPAPSPKTKPSRLRSKGRLAFWGSGFLDRAPTIPVMAIAIGLTLASAPPDIITSAWPKRRWFKAVPSASLPLAQALLRLLFGPLAPSSNPTCAGTMLGVILLIKRGSVLIGPRFFRISPCSVSKVIMPLVAITIPTLSGFSRDISSRADSTAILAAAIANWVHRAVRSTRLICM